VLVTSTHPRAVLDELRAPRTDVVIERAVGDGVFAAERGPFSLYERRIESLDDGGGGDGGMVRETTQFRLAIPFW